jgi:signal transduction histidine kinase
MKNKKTIIFPSLLFATFFCLIMVTGFFQIRIIQKNIEDLLHSEGEIFFTNIKREIDRNLEYLNLLEKSSSIITPNFLNIMVYDEAIVDDLYTVATSTPVSGYKALPYANILVLHGDGKVAVRKGNPRVPEALAARLGTGKQRTLIRMPSGNEHSLLMGIRVNDHRVFFSLTEDELESLRSRYIVKEILEREDKRFNIVGIRIYAPDKSPYVTIDGKSKDSFSLTRPLNSRFLPGFTIEILVSKDLANNVAQRTTFSLLFVLSLLVISGAISIYAIFLVERKHAVRLEEMEKELALQERLVSLGKLASGVAHEIRNPLNAIGMSIQRLKREFVPEEEKKEEYYRFVDIMRGELKRLDRIVEDFLLSTKAHVPFRDENLYTVMEEVIMVIREKADSKGITITNRMHRELKAQAQKERLKQAFYNIILNGIEAIGQKGNMEIRGEMRNRFVEIAIQDSGPGIKKDQLPSIFDYYYTTKDKGMGLGLPISYLIVKDHHGDIRVHSEEGKGTTFLITLPVIYQAGQEPDSPAATK